MSSFPAYKTTHQGDWTSGMFMPRHLF